jgi:hypothetical protein
VALTWICLPTNPFAAGLVMRIDGWVTGLQVTVCVSHEELESQAGLQVEETQTGGLCVLSHLAPAEQSVSLPHCP